MRDEEHRPPCLEPADRLVDERGARPIEIGGGLVEDDERRVSEERALAKAPNQSTKETAQCIKLIWFPALNCEP